jgi:predicted Fe-Mo cluster-binding NifX family protein
VSELSVPALRVAVASGEGKGISQHFGHARTFMIFDVTPDQVAFVESRDVDHYCHGQTGDQSAMARILVTIADCQAVFVARVGDGPRDKLAAIGVEAVDQYAWEEIEPALLDYACKRVSQSAEF